MSERRLARTTEAATAEDMAAAQAVIRAMVAKGRPAQALQEQREQAALVVALQARPPLVSPEEAASEFTVKERAVQREHRVVVA